MALANHFFVNILKVLLSGSAFNGKDSREVVYFVLCAMPLARYLQFARYVILIGVGFL